MRKEKSVSAGRRNQHAGRVRYPEQMVEETADRVVEQRKVAVEAGTVRAPGH